MSTHGGTAGRSRRAPETYYDVVIVGGRCAGSSLATLLSRAGLRVAVVEQATFPKPVLSSHLMEADGLLFLKRIGVLDAVRRTGVRFTRHVDTRLNDLRILSRWPLRFDDVGGAAFLRRHLLDSILADAAAGSGADMWMGTKVVEVLWERQRVVGVRAQRDGSETLLYAPLVVGADGRGSTVGYMVGARKYNINPNERSYYFTFFEGAAESADDTFVFHRWGDRMVWAGPADSGLYLVGVSPERHEREYFRTNTEAGLLAHMRSCEPTAEALADARIATKISGIRKFDGYFRQASGPGWVLVGDAGHFKDPAFGRGISDSFLQVEALVPAILDGLDPGGDDLDTTLRRWGQWRDKRFQGYYWLATDLGKAGTFPTMVPEAVRRLQQRGELDKFFDLFSHRSDYYDVFPLRDVGLATGRMLLSGDGKRAPLVREAISLLAQEPRRRWRNRRPELASSDTTPAPPDRLRTADATPAPPLTAAARTSPAAVAAASGTQALTAAARTSPAATAAASGAPTPAATAAASGTSAPTAAATNGDAAASATPALTAAATDGDAAANRSPAANGAAAGTRRSTRGRAVVVPADPAEPAGAAVNGAAVPLNGAGTHGAAGNGAAAPGAGAHTAAEPAGGSTAAEPAGGRAAADPDRQDPPAGSRAAAGPVADGPAEPGLLADPEPVTWSSGRGPMPSAARDG